MTNGEVKDPRQEQRLQYWLKDKIGDIVSRHRLATSGSYLSKYSADKLQVLFDQLTAREKQYDELGTDISPDPELKELHDDLQKIIDDFEKSSGP